MDQPATACAPSCASRDLGRVALIVGIANAALAVLFATGLAGAFVGVRGESTPLAPAGPSSAEPLAASVPEGYRMVCFKGADPHAILRSAPSFTAPTAGVVLRGELIELAGPNPPVIAGNGFIKVRRAINGKQVTGWMHTDVLSTAPCK
jgi:hypothetical protein